MKKTKSFSMKAFTAIELLVIVVTLIIFGTGSVVVWRGKVLPTPTPTPAPIPTPTEICRTDNDCPRGYWCPTGPGGPMAGGGYGGGTGYCVKECRVDSDCGVDAFCQDIQFFQGDVGVGYRKGCQVNSAPSPKPESTFPTEYSCNADSDCVLKNRPYCCGEKLEYYKWCYPKSVEPEVVSCKGVGSCPEIAGSAKSCVCQNGKCVAIFAEAQSSISNLHKPCDPNDQCPTGQRCISYYGIAGTRGPLFKTCEIPCPNGDSDCPKGFTCFAISDGPGLVCKKTP